MITNKDNNPFLSGPILPAMIKFGIPIFLATVLQAMYTAVDLWVVGRFLGAPDISAVATGSMVILTITLTIIGLSMGLSIYLGQRFGAKDFASSADIIGNSLWIFGVLSIIFTFLVIASASKIGELVNAPPEALAKTIKYIQICGGGIIFITAYNVISALFRGLGNSKYPLLFVFIASITNIIGDLLLVGVFKMDSAGTAIATVFAQAFSVILSLFLIKKEGFSFPVSKQNFRIKLPIITQILKLGLPLSFQNLCTGVSFTIIAGIINSMGIIASAGVGVADRIFNFIFMLPSTFAASIAAFVAQNIGAGQGFRAKQCLGLSLKLAFFSGITIFLISFFFGDILASIFTNDQAVIVAAHDFLKAIGIELFFISFTYCFLGYFNGIGFSTFVMAQGLACTFLVRIPFAFLISISAEPTMFKLGLSATTSSLCSLLIYLFFYNFGKKRIALKIKSNSK